MNDEREKQQEASPWLVGDVLRSNVRSACSLGLSVALVYGVLGFVFLWVVAPAEQQTNEITLIGTPRTFDAGYPLDDDMVVAVTSSALSTIGLGVSGVKLTARVTRIDPIKVGMRTVFCSNATLYGFDSMFTRADWVFCRTFSFSAMTGTDGVARFRGVVLPFAVAGRYFVSVEADERASMPWRQNSDQVGWVISCLNRYQQFLPLNTSSGAKESPVGDHANRIVVGRQVTDFTVSLLLVTTRSTCPATWAVALVPLTTSSFGFGASQKTTDYIADGLVDADGLITNNVSASCACRAAPMITEFYGSVPVSLLTSDNTAGNATASTGLYRYHMECKFSRVSVMGSSVKRLRVAAFSGSKSLWLDPFPQQWRMPVVTSVGAVIVTSTSLATLMRSVNGVVASPVVANRSGIVVVENRNMSVVVQLFDTSGQRLSKAGKIVFAVLTPAVDNPAVSGLEAYAHPLYTPKKALKNVAITKADGTASFDAIQLSLDGGVGFYELRVVCDGVYEGAWPTLNSSEPHLDAMLLFVASSVAEVVIQDRSADSAVVVGEVWQLAPSFLLLTSDGTPVPRKTVVLRSRVPGVVVAHSTSVRSDSTGLFSAWNISVTACASCQKDVPTELFLDVVVDGKGFGILHRTVYAGSWASLSRQPVCGAVVATQFPKVLSWDPVVFRVLPKVNYSSNSGSATNNASNATTNIMLPPYCFVTNNDGSFVQASLTPVQAQQNDDSSLFMLTLSPAYAWLSQYLFWCRCAKSATDAQSTLTATMSDFLASEVVPLLLPTFPPLVTQLTQHANQSMSMSYTVTVAPFLLSNPIALAALAENLQTVSVSWNVREASCMGSVMALFWTNKLSLFTESFLLNVPLLAWSGSVSAVFNMSPTAFAAGTTSLMMELGSMGIWQSFLVVKQPGTARIDILSSAFSATTGMSQAPQVRLVDAQNNDIAGEMVFAVGNVCIVSNIGTSGVVCAPTGLLSTVALMDSTTGMAPMAVSNASGVASFPGTMRVLSSLSSVLQRNGASGTTLGAIMVVVRYCVVLGDPLVSDVCADDAANAVPLTAVGSTPSFDCMWCRVPERMRGFPGSTLPTLFTITVDPMSGIALPMCQMMLSPEVWWFASPDLAALADSGFITALSPQYYYFVDGSVTQAVYSQQALLAPNVCFRNYRSPNQTMELCNTSEISFYIAISSQAPPGDYVVGVDCYGWRATYPFTVLRGADGLDVVSGAGVTGTSPNTTTGSASGSGSISVGEAFQIVVSATSRGSPAATVPVSMVFRPVSASQCSFTGCGVASGSSVLQQYTDSSGVAAFTFAFAAASSGDFVFTFEVAAEGSDMDAFAAVSGASEVARASMFDITAQEQVAISSSLQHSLRTASASLLQRATTTEAQVAALHKLFINLQLRDFTANENPTTSTTIRIHNPVARVELLLDPDLSMSMPFAFFSSTSTATATKRIDLSAGGCSIRLRLTDSDRQPVGNRSVSVMFIDASTGSTTSAVSIAQTSSTRTTLATWTSAADGVVCVGPVTLTATTVGTFQAVYASMGGGSVVSNAFVVSNGWSLSTVSVLRILSFGAFLTFIPIYAFSVPNSNLLVWVPLATGCIGALGLAIEVIHIRLQENGWNSAWVDAYRAALYATGGLAFLGVFWQLVAEGPQTFSRVKKATSCMVLVGLRPLRNHSSNIDEVSIEIDTNRNPNEHGAVKKGRLVRLLIALGLTRSPPVSALRWLVRQRFLASNDEPVSQLVSNHAFTPVAIHVAVLAAVVVSFGAMMVSNYATQRVESTLRSVAALVPFNITATTATSSDTSSSSQATTATAPLTLREFRHGVAALLKVLAMNDDFSDGAFYPGTNNLVESTRLFDRLGLAAHECANAADRMQITRVLASVAATVFLVLVALQLRSDARSLVAQSWRHNLRPSVRWELNDEWATMRTFFVPVQTVQLVMACLVMYWVSLFVLTLLSSLSLLQLLWSLLQTAIVSLLSVSFGLLILQGVVDFIRRGVFAAAGLLPSPTHTNIPASMSSRAFDVLMRMWDVAALVLGIFEGVSLCFTRFIALCVFAAWRFALPSKPLSFASASTALILPSADEPPHMKSKLPFWRKRRIPDDALHLMYLMTVLAEAEARHPIASVFTAMLLVTENAAGREDRPLEEGTVAAAIVRPFVQQRLLPLHVSNAVEELLLHYSSRRKQQRRAPFQTISPSTQPSSSTRGSPNRKKATSGCVSTTPNSHHLLAQRWWLWLMLAKFPELQPLRKHRLAASQDVHHDSSLSSTAPSLFSTRRISASPLRAPAVHEDFLLGAMLLEVCAPPVAVAIDVEQQGGDYPKRAYDARHAARVRDDHEVVETFKGEKKESVSPLNLQSPSTTREGGQSGGREGSVDLWEQDTKQTPTMVMMSSLPATPSSSPSPTALRLNYQQNVADLL